MKSTLATIVVAGIMIWNPDIFLGLQNHRGAEQLVFRAEDEDFKRAFVLPEAVLDILSRDPAIPDTIDGKETPRPKQLPSSYFLASVVHLAGADEEDIVVMGKCPVCGANVVPFWVFRPTPNGYEQLMFGGGLRLRVLRHRTNAYLDLQTDLVLMQKPWTGTWRFNGQKYQLIPDKKRSSE